MAQDYKDYLGYIKYEGTSVREGYLDARKASEALMGLHESIHHFAMERGGGEMPFEIPVRIQKGSWEALIPYAALTVTTAYLTSAATTIAKNDFQTTTTAEVIKIALKKIQTVIRITKHVGKEISQIDQRVVNYDTIHLKDTNGSVLTVSKDEYDSFVECPKNLLSSMVGVVDKDLVFKVGVVEKGKVTEESISVGERNLFVMEEDTEGDLFPELKDGDIVELAGEITRGNERTNSIGLDYKGHILSCRPEKGEVKQYKQALFTKAMIKGVVSRIPNEKKPQILIISISNLEEEISNPKLFK